MSIIIVYALVFSAVLLMTDVILRRIMRVSQKKQEINARLARISKGGDQVATYNRLLGERGIGSSGDEWRPWAWLMRMYRQSGLHMTWRQRILYSVVVFLVVLLASSWLVNLPVPQFLFALPVSLIVIVVLVLRFRANRIAKFIQQLPAAIDIVVRSLNAGHPLATAISLVGREMPDPIGSEFGILSDQLTFGAELDVAMLNMVDRVGTDELNLLAVTVSVQRGTGGNLAEILESLSKMIRDRGMLRAKIRAISAEGRITAIVMAMFPVGLYLMISTLQPDYFDPIWESGHGTAVVLTILGLMTFGVLILRRLVNFDF